MAQTAFITKSKILRFLIYLGQLFRRAMLLASSELTLLIRPAAPCLLRGVHQVCNAIIISACLVKKSAVPFIFIIGIVSLVTIDILATPVASIDNTASPELPEQVKLDTHEGIELETEPVEHVLSNLRSFSQDTDVAQNRPAVAERPSTGKRDSPAVIDLSKLPRIKKWNRRVLVAVLDTGIDCNHEDLVGLVTAETNLTGTSKPKDFYGHGTHVAGIIAANDNDKGVVGIAPGCSLLNVKVADDIGRCQALTLAEGILWAVENGADVINVSIQLNDSSPKLEEAVNYAWSQGSLIVAAAGNYEKESPVYPAGYESCIAVIRLTPDSELTQFLKSHDCIDVVAPGCDIYSTLPGNDYGYKTGSSFATAFISGVAALLFNLITDANGDGRLNDEVREAIEDGCLETVVDICN